MFYQLAQQMLSYLAQNLQLEITTQSLFVWLHVLPKIKKYDTLQTLLKFQQPWKISEHGQYFILFSFSICREYLLGFHKRKNERRKKAMEELTKQEKERRKELKQEVSLLQKLWLSWTVSD